MSITAIKGGLYWPPMFPWVLGTPSYGTLATLAAMSDKAAFIFQPPKSGNIRKVYWRTGTVTTGATMDIRLETVSPTDGNPTGTLWGTNTNASKAIADSDDAAFLNATLTADAAVTPDDVLALVIVNPVVSPGTLVIVNISPSRLIGEFPYCDVFATATWTKSGGWPVMAVEYDDGSIEPVQGAIPASALNTLTFASASTPDEIGVKFSLPMGGRASGFSLLIDSDDDFTVKLYDSDGSTVLTSLAVDKDQQLSQGSAGTRTRMSFPDKVTLLANTSYRLTIVPGTGGISLYEIQVSAAGLMDALPCGSTVVKTERTDAGAWTDTSTKRPVVHVMIDGVDAGSSGGVMYHPGMSGGMAA